MKSIVPCRYRLRKASTISLLLLALTGAGPGVDLALAESPTATQPDVPTEASMDPAALAVLNASVARYQSLRTYQDRGRVTVTMVSQDKDWDTWPRENVTRVAFAWAAPNRFAIVSDEHRAVCDGRHVWVSVESLRQYVERDLDAGADAVDEMVALTGNSGPVHPIVLPLMTHETDVRKIVPAIASLTGVEAEVRDGRPGQRVHGTVRMEGYGVDDPIPFSVWIDRDTRLVRELRLDPTALYMQLTHADDLPADAADNDAQADEADAWTVRQPRVDRVDMVMTLNDIQLNEAIPDDRFTFNPDENARRVDEFVYGGPEEAAQLELIGQPAPEISGQDLEGGPFSLVALKGKVVVLDFWATWCSPCVRALPQMQKLAERYEDKPVVFVGINRDSKGTEKLVHKVLDKSKVEFRQWMDGEGQAAEAYYLNGIPCTVLIDAKGVVQDIETGFGPGSADHLGENIDKVLDGERIHDPGKLARRIEVMKAWSQEPAEEPGDVGGAYAVGESFATVPVQKPERLVESESVQSVPGWRAKSCDVDGDGRSELVVPDKQGGLAIIGAKGRERQRVLLQGIGECEGVDFFAPFLEDGRQFWITAVNQYPKASVGERPSMRLFDSDGNLVWSFSPKLGEKTNGTMQIAVGDVTGDGIVDFVAGLNTYLLREEGGNTWMHYGERGYLLVADRDGNELSLRDVGKEVRSLAVMPAEAPGGRPMIVCCQNNRLRRFQYDAGASSAPATQPAERQKAIGAGQGANGEEAKAAPGMDDDPMVHFRRGRELARQGKNEAALAEYLSYFGDGAKGHPKFVGVRDSLVLEYVAELGKTYPPARAALRERRDDAQARVDRGGIRPANLAALMDLAALNAALGEHDRNARLYDATKKEWADAPVLDLIEHRSGNALPTAGRLESPKDAPPNQGERAVRPDLAPRSLPAGMVRPPRPVYWIDRDAFAESLASAADAERRGHVLDRRWEQVKRAIARCRVVGVTSFHRSLSYWQDGLAPGWALRAREDLAEPVEAGPKAGVEVRGDCRANVTLRDGIVHILGDLHARVAVTGQSEVVVGGDVGTDGAIQCDGIVRVFIGGDLRGAVESKRSCVLWINGSHRGSIRTGSPNMELHVLGDYLGYMEPLHEAALLSVDVGGYMSTDSIKDIARHGYTQFTASVGVSDRPPGLYSSPKFVVPVAHWVVHSQAGE